MNILAISGSPRPARNTASLMKLVIEAAKTHVSDVDAMWCNLNDMTYSDASHASLVRSQLPNPASAKTHLPLS